MSEKYNEEHPEEIHPGETAGELEEHGENEAEAKARAAEAKLKKDKKLKVGLFGGLAVVAVGFLGLKIIGAGSPAPKPNIAFPAPAQSPASVAPDVPPMGPPPTASALPGSPTASPMPAAPGFPAASGLPAAPAPSAFPAAPAAMSPAAASQGISSALPASAVLAQGPAEPAAPTASAPGSAVAVAEAPKPSVDGFARGFDELAKKIDDLKSMFSKFDEMNIGDRLAKLEQRVGALEGGKVAPRPAAASNGAAVAKRHYHAPKSGEPRMVPLGQGEDLLFARIAEPKPNTITPLDAEPRTVVRALPTATRSYSLHAVIPNRIWIKGQDGTSQTFENGETLPDGSKILKIDPDRGDVVTSKGVLKFEAR